MTDQAGTQSMVERVARAMLKSETSWQWSKPEPEWTVGDLTRNGYMHYARAAIEAMREPTEAMRDHAASADFPDHLGGRASFETHWDLGIAAALSEEGE